MELKIRKRRKRAHPKCFIDVYRKQRLWGQRALGLQVVEIDKIVGSVGRCKDFDGEFQPLDERTIDRYRAIEKAMSQGDPLPPVQLYKIKDEYYVIDGNHRIAAAKKLGQAYIEAEVIEYLPVKDSLANILYNERSDFEFLTGLKGLILTEIGQYTKLLNQIHEHKYYLSEGAGGEIPLKEAAQAWFNNIYKPVMEKIEELGVLGLLPGLTIADLYVAVCDYKWMESKKRGYDIGFEKAISELLGDLPAWEPERTLKERIIEALLPCSYIKSRPLRKGETTSSLKRLRENYKLDQLP